tara:strand:+ start:6395 stop:6724 length:330 start_codon:yes stop_codon:yes gene_type:complete
MKSVVGHWKYQRYSAILLLFISLWLSISIICFSNYDYNQIVSWIRSPYGYLLLLVFFITSFFHARLGIQVVLEDYVSNEGLRNNLILIVKYLSWLLSALAVLFVLMIVF